MSGAIRFDALCIGCALAEIAPLVGSKLQQIRQPSQYEIWAEFHGAGKTSRVLISTHPDFYRLHLVQGRMGSVEPLPAYCVALRKYLLNSTLVSVTQIRSDRIVEMKFCGDLGTFRWVIELMGKHSHQILIGPDSKMIASARWIGSKDSARPVVPGKPYLLPRTTKDASDINEFGSAKALASVLHSQHPQAISPNWNPGYAEGFGAYPFSLSKSHPTWRATESFSLACETVFETIQIQHAIESLRSSLTGSLQRIRLSRTAALNDVNENIAKGGKAPYWQLCGELTLTYQSEISAGSAFAELHDYEGKLVVVDLDPDLTCAENAQLYFAKAKKAKRRAAELVDKQLMLTREVEMLASFLNQAEVAQTLPQLLAIRHKLVEDRWLKLQSAEPKRKVEDPFGGHRIKREIGYKREEILVGQSATANDYLIQRVARPNDIWLHVRGHTSAHVLIKTQNKPEKVDRKTLELAAKLCVANSATKHSSLVSVDYTLAKYVRKPKGSKPGSVIYTHEKTIDVSS